MSKEKLEAVSELISQKRYNEARAILETIEGEPAAQKLLDQINRKAPVAKRRSTNMLRGYVLTVLLSVLLTSAFIAVLVVVTAPNRPGSTSIQAASNGGASTSDQEVTPTPTELPRVTIGVVQSNQTVNVRSGPGTNFDRVGSLSPNEEVLVLGESDTGEWRNIRLPGGDEGWIRSDLLRVSQVPVTVAAVEVAVEITPEPTPLPTCTPDEARAWWDAHPLYGQANLALLQAQQDSEADIATLRNQVNNQRASYESAPYPPCAEVVRQNILAGTSEVIAALNAYAAGNTESAGALAENARMDYYAAALEVLNDDLGVRVNTTDCGAEFWYISITPVFNALSDLIDTAPTLSAGSDAARAGVFRVQELRRDLDAVYAPLCVTNARDRLREAIENGADLYRAVFDGDQNRIADAGNRVNTSRGGFFQALTTLGVAL